MDYFILRSINPLDYIFNKGKIMLNQKILMFIKVTGLQFNLETHTFSLSLKISFIKYDIN